MDKVRHQFKQLVQGEYRDASILILGMLVMLIGEFSTALAVTKIFEVFGNNEPTIQLVNILPLALLALMYPLGPIWLQKKSIAQLFKASLLIFMLGSLLVGFANSILILIIGRIVQTIGCGIMLPMFSGLIMALLPEEKQSFELDQMGDIILGVAIVLALFLSGISFLLGNWQLINIFLIVLSIIIYYYTSLIEIDLEVSSYEIEWANVALSSGFLILIGWIITLSDNVVTGWLNGGLFVLGIGLIIIYIWRELHVENPLIDFKGLFDIRYLRAVLLQGIGDASLAVLMIIGILYLRQGLHYSVILIGLALMPSILVMILMHHCTKKFFKKLGTVNNTRIAMGLMMVGWGCLTLFSTYLNLILFIVLTIVIEAGHGLLVQVGKKLSRKQKSTRLNNMADIFMAQFKLMFSSMVLAVLSVVLQNVTDSHTNIGLPGKLATLAGYRAAFSLFFVITILGWIITMIAGRNFNLSKHIVK
jgi:DHA2 family lincomycin resistance protein-like MFS transporter